MECKSCRHFIQGDGHRGTCRKKPYVTSRQGGVAKINGKPRQLVVHWSHKACKMFEQEMGVEL